jgi:hypothetical protein
VFAVVFSSLNSFMAEQRSQRPEAVKGACFVRGDSEPLTARTARNNPRKKERTHCPHVSRSCLPMIYTGLRSTCNRTFKACAVACGFLVQAIFLFLPSGGWSRNGGIPRPWQARGFDSLELAKLES